jgi:hypothetical protein
MTDMIKRKLNDMKQQLSKIEFRKQQLIRFPQVLVKQQKLSEKPTLVFPVLLLVDLE